jgi:hypothetical protein
LLVDRIRLFSFLVSPAFLGFSFLVSPAFISFAGSSAFISFLVGLVREMVQTFHEHVLKSFE